MECCKQCTRSESSVDMSMQGLLDSPHHYIEVRLPRNNGVFDIAPSLRLPVPIPRAATTSPVSPLSPNGDNNSQPEHHPETSVYVARVETPHSHRLMGCEWNPALYSLRCAVLEPCEG